MFGHQDDDKPADQDSNAIPDETVQQVLNDGDGQATVTVPDAAAAAASTDPVAVSMDTPSGSPPAQTDEQPWQHPGNPIDSAKEPIKDIISPAGGFPKKPTYQYPIPSIASNDNPAPKNDDDDPATKELIDVKKRALDDLIPIIDKLDLPPEEKFRTIMMMIQSSDNQNLVKSAYVAAHSIEDETARAQALLDIINEVNYFTNPPGDQPAADE
ncbi:MAG TPA: hypothetical protein VFC50_02145 [Candidatus Dormibacteraeota bacterium]|nr:hypothetical protein [Candidatus Dormibacteraeota bacterium]